MKPEKRDPVAAATATRVGIGTARAIDTKQTITSASKCLAIRRIARACGVSYSSAKLICELAKLGGRYD